LGGHEAVRINNYTQQRKAATGGGPAAGAPSSTCSGDSRERLAAPLCDNGGKTPIGMGCGKFRLLAARNLKSQQAVSSPRVCESGIARLSGRHLHQAETGQPLLNATTFGVAQIGHSKRSRRRYLTAQSGNHPAAVSFHPASLNVWKWMPPAAETVAPTGISHGARKRAFDEQQKLSHKPYPKASKIWFDGHPGSSHLLV
jgi:hypothetical protein